MWFFIGFFFSFKKKKKTSFPLGHLICSFEKNLEIGKIQKMQERHYLQQQLESHFWPGKHWNLIFSISIKVVDNWISFVKTSIPNQLEFLAARYGQNTKQVQMITQSQHYLQFSLKISNGDQHKIFSSLSNRLILSLCFRKKIFEK